MPTGSHIYNQKIGPRRFLNLLATKHSLDWWVFFLYCVPAFEAQVVFDSGRLGGPVITWFWLALSSLTAVGILWAVGRWVLIGKDDKVNPYAVLLFFALLGLVRGSILHEFAFVAKLEDDSQLIYRYVTAPTFAVVLLGTLAFVVANVRLYQFSIQDLTKERARLRLASINLKAQIDKTHTELQTHIFGILGPAIDELERRLEAIKDSASLSNAVNALKVTVDDVVRPLSHNVAVSNFEELVLETDQTIKQDSRQQRYKMKVTMRPLWSALISGAIGVGPAMVSNSTSNGWLVAGFLMLTLYLVLKLVAKIAGNELYNILVAGLITVLSYSAAGGVFILASQLVAANPTAGEQAQILVLLSLLGGVMFVLELASTYRARNLESLIKVNERFKLLNSRMRRQVWLDHRHMAGILHGQLQGALYAAAIRLNQSGEPNQFLIENVKSEIQQALGELTRESKPEHRFDVILGEMISMWEDAVIFETKFEFGAMETLNNNPEASECTIEVIREAINNAVKHGAATKIKIGLELDGQLIQVLVQNEGKPLPEETQPGYGSDVLSEYTHKWWRKPLENGTELGALVLL